MPLLNPEPQSEPPCSADRNAERDAERTREHRAHRQEKKERVKKKKEKPLKYVGELKFIPPWYTPLSITRNVWHGSQPVSQILSYCN